MRAILPRVGYHSIVMFLHSREKQIFEWEMGKTKGIAFMKKNSNIYEQLKTMCSSIFTPFPCSLPSLKEDVNV